MPQIDFFFKFKTKSHVHHMVGGQKFLQRFLPNEGLSKLMENSINEQIVII